MGVVTERAGLPLWSDYSRFLRRHRVLLVCLIGARAARRLGVVDAAAGHLLGDHLDRPRPGAQVRHDPDTSCCPRR